MERGGRREPHGRTARMARFYIAGEDDIRKDRTSDIYVLRAMESFDASGVRLLARCAAAVQPANRIARSTAAPTSRIGGIRSAPV